MFLNKYYLRGPEARTDNYCHLSGIYELVKKNSRFRTSTNTAVSRTLCIWFQNKNSKTANFFKVDIITPFLTLLRLTTHIEVVPRR